MLLSSAYQTMSGEGLAFQFLITHGSMCGSTVHNQNAPQTTPELLILLHAKQTENCYKIFYTYLITHW